jgi:hypothetical protein
MTLKGKRKALNNNPEAQIAAISEAYYGRVPVKPIYRHCAEVGWLEGDTWHTARISRRKLYHLLSKSRPQVGVGTKDASSACKVMELIYHYKITLQDLQEALAGPKVVAVQEKSKDIILLPSGSDGSLRALPTKRYDVR